MNDSAYPKTWILRHRRENLAKCSLTPLQKREDFQFFTYPKDTLVNCQNHFVLKIGAPPLTEQDQGKGILLLDGTWRLAEVMERQIPQDIEARSLGVDFQTAYPRRQTECPDPKAGLSSLEALFIAYWILKRPLDGLLDHYYWKDLFFERNPRLLHLIS
jgi:pre-rRNA-processing protein TSR3